MSTSGTYNFTVNRDQIIRDAMLNIGKLDAEDQPTPQDVTDCSFKLNMLIKQWMGKADYAPGLKVWTRRRGSLFLKNTVGPYVMGPASTTGWTADTPATPLLTAAANAAATALQLSSVAGLSANMYIGIQVSSGALYWTTITSVGVGSVVIPAPGLPASANIGAQVFAYTTIAQRPLDISAVVLRDNQNTDTPMRIMTSEQYDLLSNKVDPQNTGDPTAVYTENMLDYTYLYTDIAVAQDVSKRLVVTYLEPVQDINSAADNFEYPQEWFLALSWGLAKQIAPMYHAPWTQLMEDNYKNALAVAQHKDAETTTMYFLPGEDGTYVA